MLVASIVIFRVEKVRVGNEMVCPPDVRDAPPSSSVTGRAPSKRKVTRVIQRLRGPYRGWTTLIWSVVTGWAKAIRRYWPTGLSKAPTVHAVRTFPSMAWSARFSGV